MIARVTGPDDPRLAPYRLVADPAALARAGLFVAEGRLVLPVFLASAYEPHSVLLSEPALEQLGATLAPHPDLDVLVAPADVISQIGGHDFHRGCLALGKRNQSSIFNLQFPMIFLERVSNPDNIGGIFRSALAFGAGSIVLGDGCGDPLYRKAIRTSMGATLQVTWTASGDWEADLRAAKGAGATLVALTPHPAAAALHDVVAGAAGPLAFLLGSEGHGLTEETMRLADVRARIPIAAGADSLNVAAAAAIALYEASRASRPRQL